ncbi:hypothetical protein RSAG8_13597, partial [Rhizoctonia solani AG-8 WAC10335]
MTYRTRVVTHIACEFYAIHVLRREAGELESRYTAEKRDQNEGEGYVLDYIVSVAVERKPERLDMLPEPANNFQMRLPFDPIISGYDSEGILIHMHHANPAPLLNAEWVSFAMN